MNKKFLKEQKEKLEEQKEKLEKQLSGFAKKNKDSKSDWITKYPDFDGDRTEGGKIEEEEDEVEEYDKLLSVSYTLEKELEKIATSLSMIKKGTYGLCEKCHKPIPQGRLKVYPQARRCLKCH